MFCKNCGKRFYSDCADVCQRCFIEDIYKERKAEAAIARAEALVRIRGFKLKIELVPESSWYRNLRAGVSSKEWDKIRYRTYREGGYRCRICGRKQDTLYCHEIWQYNDDTHVQKLMGFEAICELCHRVHHIGLAHIQLSKVEYNKVIKHYRSVNQCSYQDFWIARDEAENVWEERSLVDWSIDFSEYGELVKGGVLPPSA